MRGEATIETLQYWSQWLFWLSILLPILGALLGAAAGVARYYVDRREKQLSLESIKARTAPRRLALEQADSLGAALSKHNPAAAIVACRLMDGESCDYAEDIAVALRRAGWTVPQVVKTSLNDFNDIRVYNAGSDQHPGYQELLEAFATARVSHHSGPIAEDSVGSFQRGVLYVVIGRKPPS